jgi:hypothetical protein
MTLLRLPWGHIILHFIDVFTRAIYVFCSSEIVLRKLFENIFRKISLCDVETNDNNSILRVESWTQASQASVSLWILGEK